METLIKSVEQLDPIADGESSEQLPSIGRGETDHHALYKLYDLTNPTKRTDDILKGIWEWAYEKSDLKTRDDILLYINRVVRSLGTSPFQSPWAKLNMYVKFDRARADLEQKMADLKNDVQSNNY